MSARLRLFASRLLLLALMFNALSPLIAAAQDHAGRGPFIAFCTADGLKPIALDAQGKVLPRPALQNPCPFCLLGAMAATLPTTSSVALHLPRQMPVAIAYLAPALPTAPLRFTAAPRGPPALV